MHDEELLVLQFVALPLGEDRLKTIYDPQSGVLWKPVFLPDHKAGVEKVPENISRLIPPVPKSRFLSFLLFIDRMGQDDCPAAMHPGVCPERRNELFHKIVMGPADEPRIVLFRGGKGLDKLRCSGEDFLVFIPDLANTEKELLVFYKRPEIC